MPQPLPSPFLTSTRGLDEGPRGPAGSAGTVGPAGAAGADGADGTDGVPLPFNVVPGPEYISYGQTADTFPTAGLARIGSSVGAGNVVAPVVTWRRGSGAVHDLITVRDSSSAFAEVVFNGPTGSNAQTVFTGNRLRVNVDQVILNPTAIAGSGSLLFNNTAIWGSDPNPSFGGGIGVLYFGSTIALPTSGGPHMFRSGSHGIATRFNQGDYWSYYGSAVNYWDILSSWTRNDPHSGGVPYNRFRGRGGYGAGGVVWGERETFGATGPNGLLLKYWIPDETVATLTWRVTMGRKTNATKGGTFRGRATIRRTGGGVPVHVGTSPQYEADVETTAGDGVDIFINPVAYDPNPPLGLVYEIQIRPVCADSDFRRWFLRCEVEEVRST